VSRERTRSPLPWCALALLALLLWAPVAQCEVPVPPLKAHVTDLTATLSADQRNTLERALASLESRKGSQVAVLMVPTVQPESIEQYAIRAYDQWKLGRKGVDDGVLLIIAKNDRKLRIEVGYGLEGTIPDAVAKRIIDTSIVPRFKQADFYGGIHAGVDRIVRLVAGEVLPAPRQANPRASRVGPSIDHVSQLFFGFIALMVVGGIFRSIFGRLIGAAINGVAMGVLAYYFLIGLEAALIAAVVVFLFTLIAEFKGTSRGGWSSGGGSWSSGGGGGFSGGGFSGGGFSGGGGSSGGGGASGSW